MSSMRLGIVNSLIRYKQIKKVVVIRILNAFYVSLLFELNALLRFFRSFEKTRFYITNFIRLI